MEIFERHNKEEGSCLKTEKQLQSLMAPLAPKLFIIFIDAVIIHSYS